MLRSASSSKECSTPTRPGAPPAPACLKALHDEEARTAHPPLPSSLLLALQQKASRRALDADKRSTTLDTGTRKDPGLIWKATEEGVASSMSGTGQKRFETAVAAAMHCNAKTEGSSNLLFLLRCCWPVGSARENRCHDRDPVLDTVPFSV
ncbi:hypothetical protein BDA96_10G081400 [Sorghum bicolor]|uniref:Uncharacterized protein n=2 Tax=Sorghum bicolor TaxID=4558 RepID=A0A921Q0L2_SORBI|nr:hypothetical protein BDA96_10G081400 [Sorghum bicolor]OQU75982.1 hypothetical protein SORBI_3010G068051 [Sorghum bicolor]